MIVILPLLHFQGKNLSRLNFSLPSRWASALQTEIYKRFYFKHGIKWLENNDLLQEIWSFCWKNSSFRYHWKIDGAWHTPSAMLVYQWRYKSVTLLNLTWYWFQRDVIGTPFFQGTWHNRWSFPGCYGNRSMLSSNLWLERSMAYSVCHALLELYVRCYLKFIQKISVIFSYL